MKTNMRRWSDWSTGLGFAFALLAAWFLIYRDGYGSLAWPLLALGCGSMFVGFWCCIGAKGYNPAWALLLFVVGPLLFFVFFFLPDRFRQPSGRAGLDHRTPSARRA
jgi:hypothetical protein